MLTRSNYGEWSVLMKVMLEARGLWNAVSFDDAEYEDDRMAMEAILRAVPPDMMVDLAEKETAKRAWDTIKRVRVGSDRVRKANAQTLRREFGALEWKTGEMAEDFARRASNLAARLTALGDRHTDEDVVRKVLQVAPTLYSHVAMSIETLLDLDTMSVEDLVSRFVAVEARDAAKKAQAASTGEKLYLTEEEWFARMKIRDGGESSGSGSRSNNTRQRGRGRGRGANGGSRGAKSGQGSGSRSGSTGAATKDDECLYCGKKGHWARDCRKKKREQANLAQVDGEEDDEPALMMAVVAPAAEPAVDCARVFLNEKRVVVDLNDDAVHDTTWYLDTGASNHMTGDAKAFSDLDHNITGSVRFGDGSIVDIKGRGTIVFLTKQGHHRALTNVYLIPRLRSNILSIGQLDEIGCRVLIDGGVLRVWDRQRQLLAKVNRSRNRLYVLPLTPAQPVCMMACLDDDSWLWHARYGHINFKSLQQLAWQDMVRGLPTIDHVDELCEACLAGKQRRSSFPQQARYRATDLLGLVHGDLCGPITPATPAGKKYFLLLVDDLSRFMWLYLLESKDEAPEAIKRFKAMAELQAGRKLRTLRTDRGGEFNSANFDDFCAEQGVQRHLTAPYSPQQNGVVERRNQTVLAMARSMMKAKNMPAMFWGEAVHTAVFLLNRAPTRAVEGKTPYEVWHGERPAVHFLKVFGCVAHVKPVKPHASKLDDRSTPMVFLGYEAGTKGYRVYNPVTKRLQVSRDVVFDERAAWDWSAQGEFVPPGSNIFTMETDTMMGPGLPSNGGAPSPAPSCTTSPSSTASPYPAASTPTAEPSTTRSSPRSDVVQGGPVPWEEQAEDAAVNPAVEFASPTTAAKSTLDMEEEGAAPRFRKLDNILATSEPMQFEELHLVAGEEPSTFAEAAPHVEWRQAMLEELRAIDDNNTWVLTELPPSHKPIGLKWVFKLKKDADGVVVKHKARLVAKGYIQRPGVDFEEVFAPVARLESVRLLIAIAAHRGWLVHHMDVKSAFLNGDLAELVFVSQPPGFELEGQEHKVYKLNKALYGLRQAPRAWNTKLDSTLLSLGFRSSAIEHAVYVRGKGDSLLLVGVYVDDLIIVGAQQQEVDKFKGEMKHLFKMSDLGALSYYLGIEVKQNDQGITLCQSAYAGKVLEKVGLLDCNPCSVPMQPRLKLSKQSSNPPVDATLYRSLVGSLRYLVHTRPDIAFAVSYVSRFMEAPTTEHMAAVKHLLRYIAGTRSHGCFYNRGDGDLNLIGYSDSDLAGDRDDSKSTSGVLFLLGNKPVSWQSQKQRVVALSSCEAEYIAASTAGCQGLWLSRLLADLLNKDVVPPTIYIDNKSAIALAKNPGQFDRCKHIEIRYHFLRDCVNNGGMVVEYISTGDQLADMLTKPLPRDRLQELRVKSGIINTV